MIRQPEAILFGSIGSLVETSELQRQAYNAAFKRLGMDWVWGRSEYRDLLRDPGGTARIAAFAAARGEDVDVDRIHRAKVAYFRAAAEEGLELRPGVPEVIARAQAVGVRMGLATTTGSDTVDLVLDGLKGQVDRNAFAFVGDRDFVTRPKPSPEIYRVALVHLGLTAAEVVAIEDTPEAAQAAVGAGVTCVAFPGEAARDRAFPGDVAHHVDRLQPGLLGLRGAAA